MIYAKDENYILYQGKMQDVIDNELKEKSVDCIVTDPPYELNFMNKGWDNSGVAFQKETWEKCLKVLKPGGYLLAFGGTRTYHRIACAIEDAGFEIRDCIMWLYGSGFPKSFNIGKQIEAKVLFNDASGRSQKKLKGEKVEASMWTHHWSYENGKERKDYSELSKNKVINVEYQTELGKKWKGYGTQLKPAYEPIIVARKPVEGSIIDNVIKYGVGGLNIDECRVGQDLIKGGTMPDLHDVGVKQKAMGNGHIMSFGQIRDAKRLELEDHYGRFPANVILTYDKNDEQEVCSGFPNTKSTGGSGEASIKNTFKNVRMGATYNTGANLGGLGDEGSAARYFYTAKASSKDRDEGLDDFEKVNIYDGQSQGYGYGNTENDNLGDRIANVKRANIHPTVKPTDLMQYLVRLVAPKGATIMDCFMGSGSTGKAVMFENRERNADYKFIGIEMTEEYLPICKARIDYAKYKYEYDLKVEKKKDEESGIQSIFDYIGDE